jgi:hypothetical protein
MAGSCARRSANSTIRIFKTLQLQRLLEHFCFAGGRCACLGLGGGLKQSSAVNPGHLQTFNKRFSQFVAASILPR